MKVSKLFLPTLKETPKDAVIKSHILMLRSGMIRKSASGLYSYLPLGFKVLKKVIQIAEEEMDKIGAQEFLPPILTSRELWEETGRYSLMGPQMWRIKDRHQQDFVLGPTHEESFTDLVRRELSSYKQLPLIVYQVYKKFRDEIRPRYGVMRGREFTMKDAYSYHADETDLSKTYEDMRKAYRQFFKRCGLDTVPVQADSGSMGGKTSEEFMVRSHIGEDTIIECPACGYVANAERAECTLDYEKKEEAFKTLETKDTPNIKTIEALTAFFQCSPKQFIKTLIYEALDQEKVVVLIRGDLEVNQVKLTNAMMGKEFQLAKDETVVTLTQAPVGFAGPVGLKNVKIIADESVRYIVNGITGANQKDQHLVNVNFERDFRVDEFFNLRLTKKGDSCPQCKKELHSFEGIEVGHIFKLGYKYTQDMKAVFLDASGKEQHPIMGCYGIGIDRTIATVIEQNHDEDGIIFPMSIAPYQVSILPLSEEAFEPAEKLYNELWKKGIETLLDDRDLRPGFKFKDADLIGIPIRVTLGKKTLAEGKAELKLRKEKTNTLVLLDELSEKIEQMIKTEMEILNS
ncbi:MAG: proline--tRNA ligase [Spirochaetes bacterium GWB1_36_13]|nr:MAG: proline--tRNA ligase [Spirochaetes bacterium GWB1_36_13]